MCTTVRDYISQLKQTVKNWKELKVEGISCHDYGPWCVKQEIAQIQMLSNKMISKIEQISSSRQIQKCLDHIKPLFRAENTLYNLKKDVSLLHAACDAVTLDAQKRSIQYTAEELGLKFVQGDNNCYISLDADQFYIEITFGDTANGSPSVTQVGLVNEGKPQHSVLITECLQQRDYKGFRDHLKGLASVFNIPTEPRFRPILYKALRALEEDLAQMYSETSSNSINGGCVACVIPPQGGIGMQLLYHSDSKSKACISVECSKVVQLPTAPIYIGSGCDAEHSFRRLGLNNSEYVECSYVLRLDPPVTMTTSHMSHILERLGHNTVLKCAGTIPLTNILLLSSSERNKQQDRPLTIKAQLKDDQHVYYFPAQCQEAILVHRIPFTHPSEVPIIISALRQQQTFNALLLSCNMPAGTMPGQCIDNKTESGPVNPNIIPIDVTYTAPDSIQCMFAHPFKLTLTTLNMTVSSTSVDVTNPDTIHNNIITNIMSKCQSIPLTLRALTRVLKHHHDNPSLHTMLPTVSDSQNVMAQITDHAGSQVLLLGLNTAFNDLNSPPITSQHTTHMSSPPITSQHTTHVTSPPITAQHTAHMTSPLMPALPLMKQPSPSVLRMTPSPPIVQTINNSPPNKKVPKRKRPMLDTEGPKAKKISKVVKINEKPNIPKLEPMSSQLKHLSHPPIGPPSLKPAPVHPSSPPTPSLMIPNLSPAPHMTVRPGGLPSPQPILRIVPSLSQIKNNDPDKTI